jgi:pimeloyl-ACP methyl ester carboxylesterase
MNGFDSGGASFRTACIGAAGDAAAVQFIWGHGWGQDHRALLGLARQLESRGAHVLLDFPGFGASPPPPSGWGTEDYADAIAAWLEGQPPARRIWIGHSFGCRVGIQLAARHPGLLSGLVLIAAAGLRRRRSLAQRIALRARVSAYKTLRRLAALGLKVDRWRDRLGSSDYRAAGVMRPVLVNVIREDLSEVAAKIRCPTLLLCGTEDREAPPEISRRLEKLIPGAQLGLLEGFDHYTILTTGRHQAVFRISQFLEGLRH